LKKVGISKKPGAKANPNGKYMGKRSVGPDWLVPGPTAMRYSKRTDVNISL